MKKMIILDITEEDYNAGLEMLGGAMMIAYTHGMWDVDKGNRVFGPNGWLPKWEELKDVEEFTSYSGCSGISGWSGYTPEEGSEGVWYECKCIFSAFDRGEKYKYMYVKNKDGKILPVCSADYNFVMIESPPEEWLRKYGEEMLK